MESQYLINRRNLMLGLKQPPEARGKKPIAKRSEKMKGIMKRLKKAYTAYLKKHPRCRLKMAGCTKIATAIHHTKGRIGELLEDERYWMPTCENCNRMAEEKDAEAREKGIKISKFKKEVEV